jgi:replicative DNA helicase
MNLDGAFLAAVLREGKEALIHAMELGVTSELLDEDFGSAFAFILEHYREYKELPDPNIVVARTGVMPEGVPGNAEFYTKEIRSRQLFRWLQKGIDTSSRLLEKGDPHGSFAALEELLRDVRKESLTSNAVIPLFGMGPEVLEHYDRMKAGERGILTRWPSVNDSTLGFWPEDLIMFVARLSVGKTWSSIILANDAWRDGHKVLYVTTEMSRLKIATRFFAVTHQMPYGRVRSGQLDPFMERQFRTDVEALQNEDGIGLVGGDFDFRIESLEAAIEQFEPQIVVCDGAYLLRSSGKDRFEKASNVFDDLKRLAKRSKIPIVVTSQLNRSGQGRAPTAANIALSDTAGWNADVIFGMIQTDDLRQDRRMLLKPLKIREGTSEEIELNWDFENMNFEELPRAGASPQGGGGDADEGEDSDDDPIF